MRRLGPTLAAPLLAAMVATAQPPALPVQPAPPAQPATPPPAAPNPRLAAHLDGWEQTMGQLVNFSAEFDLTRTDNVFKKDRLYGGSVLCMKPNYALLRIESKDNKADYEAYLSNGRSVFHYDGPKKTVTEFKLNPGAGADNLMLDFLGGMKAKAAKERFVIGLQNEDKNFVVLDIQPVLGKDKQEFVQARLALLAPGNEAKLPAYLPYHVWMMQPNGNTEMWKLRKHATNSPGVDGKLFQYQPIPGWQLQQAPPAGAPAPGGAPALPTGGPAPRP